MKLRCLAPAKVNLSLFLGSTREDGRHRLVTVFESVSLADELVCEVLDSGPDEVICPGVEGENLASRALVWLRARGWSGPALRITIDKRIPVAAGMAGGSADAAAVLRLAMAVAPGRAEEVDAIAAQLGADVPSQLLPGVAVGTGAGEIVEHFEALGEHALLVVPSEFALATPDVFREADRLGLPRTDAQLAGLYLDVLDGLVPGERLPDQLILNDLAAAAISLRPECAQALAALRDAGADHALVSGSGPTVFGIWWGGGARERASLAGEQLRQRYPDAVVVSPVDAEYAAPALI